MFALLLVVGLFLVMFGMALVYTILLRQLEELEDDD